MGCLSDGRKGQGESGRAKGKGGRAKGEGGKGKQGGRGGKLGERAAGNLKLKYSPHIYSQSFTLIPQLRVTPKHACDV